MVDEFDWKTLGCLAQPVMPMTVLDFIVNEVGWERWDEVEVEAHYAAEWDYIKGLGAD
jgi:hypothetical protein